MRRRRHRATWVSTSVIIAALFCAAPAAADTLDDAVALVTETTEALPDHFANDGPARSEELEGPLPTDVLAYARFYWTVDAVEGACSSLGQRTNIEMVAPEISTRLVYPSMREEHPDHAEFLRIYEFFDAAVTELGEDVVCPAIYELLGPGGTLMPAALSINGLLEDDLAAKYEVREGDGVIWSDRDYCERRYYLEQPADQAMHDLVCARAKEQGF